jgi:hypothetical protein
MKQISYILGLAFRALILVLAFEASIVQAITAVYAMKSEHFFNFEHESEKVGPKQFNN